MDYRPDRGLGEQLKGQKWGTSDMAREMGKRGLFGERDTNRRRQEESKRE